MNECEKYQEMISAMLDGELDAVQSEQLIEHMSSCARCRELYEMLSAVTGSDVWELPEAPERLHEHIMSGVKAAAAGRKRQGRVTHLRPLATAAACLVLIAGVLLGVPRFSRGDNASSAPAAFNATAAANNNSAPADNAAPAEAPAENAGGTDSSTRGDGYEGSGKTAPAADDGTSSVNQDKVTSFSPETEPEAAPVPEPDAPEAPESAEPPALDIDIDRSVVIVESGGKSTSEKLSRDDTLIWLRAVIEGRAGSNIDAAKIEIYRLEGTDYEVYIYHDGEKLMGSLTEEPTDGIELRELSDFAQFEEMADNVK